MADDQVNIEVDGAPVKARKGEMIIRATDRAGVYVPHFCYHEKHSIAANCRMCLVEVERAPKPLPACATPVAEGMKVFTKSPRAIGAQRATMEFLLINHPLDCPICDQGGECELQDLAVGFGRDVSRYHEGKRSVPDENLGPLIATDMTRCIHCTRCIRFSYEGIYSPDRLTTPLLRRGASWAESDWESALGEAAAGLRARAGDLGVLVSPSCTLEELYLAARIARGLGTQNVDHRLRQRDFRDQQADPVFPGLGMALADVEALDSLLVIGANLRRAVPILAHRLRKAALRGAQVAMLNPARFAHLFPVRAQLTSAPADLVGDLAAVLAAAAAATGKRVPPQLASAVGEARVTNPHPAATPALLSGERRAVWLGALAARHAAFADLRALAAALAQLAGATLA